MSIFSSIAEAVAGPVVSGLFGQVSANQQMRFQERSQRRRYQWTMEDMRKAGLNPILAYQQGGGSALSGARATMPAPDVPGAQTAKSLRRVQDQQSKLLSQQTVKAMAEAETAANQASTSALDAQIADDASSLLYQEGNEALREAVAYAKAVDTMGGLAPTVVASARAAGALSKSLGKAASKFKSKAGASSSGKKAADAATRLSPPHTPRKPSLFE